MIGQTKYYKRGTDYLVQEDTGNDKGLLAGGYSDLGTRDGYINALKEDIARYEQLKSQVDRGTYSTGATKLTYKDGTGYAGYDPYSQVDILKQKLSEAESKQGQFADNYNTGSQVINGNFVNKAGLDSMSANEAKVASGEYTKTMVNGVPVYSPKNANQFEQGNAGQSTALLPSMTKLASAGTPDAGTYQTQYTPATSSMPGVNLQPGMKGDSVKQLQDYLVESGYMTREQVNSGYGTYGPQTTAAVAELQRDLRVDNAWAVGYWGPKTQTAISSYMSANPSGTTQPGNTSSTGSTQSNPWDSVIKLDPFLSTLLTDPSKKASFDAMPDEVKSIFLQTASSLGKAIEAGKVVNPNIQITPAQLTQFYDQASSELDPYYREQFSTMRGGLDTSLARLTTDYEKSVQRAIDPFNQSLREQDESEAGAGTAFSSGRVDRQNTAVTGMQNKIDDATLATTRSASDLLTGYEGKVGTNTARGVQIPALSTYAASPSGITSTGSRSIDPGLLGGISYGSVGAEQETARKLRAAELEKTYRTDRVLNTTSL